MKRQLLILTTNSSFKSFIYTWLGYIVTMKRAASVWDLQPSCCSCLWEDSHNGFGDKHVVFLLSKWRWGLTSVTLVTLLSTIGLHRHSVLVIRFGTRSKSENHRIIHIYSNYGSYRKWLPESEIFLVQAAVLSSLITTKWHGAHNAKLPWPVTPGDGVPTGHTHYPPHHHSAGWKTLPISDIHEVNPQYTDGEYLQLLRNFLVFTNWPWLSGRPIRVERPFSYKQDSGWAQIMFHCA